MMHEHDTEMAEANALLRGFELTGHLGAGLNGRVRKVRDYHKRAWALKIQDAQGFKLERACYERLAEHEVTEVAGFNVPVLIHAEERYETWEGRYEDDWPAVELALRELRLLGIYCLDVHRGNIAL